MYEFSDWLTAKGFTADTLTAEQKVTLQGAWRAEVKPADATPPPAPAPAATSAADSFDSIISQAEGENARRAAITALVAKALEENPDQVAMLGKMGRLAIDGKWTTQQTELALLRAGRGNGPHVHVPTAPAMSGDVLEAAVCLTTRLPGVEKKYDERTLQAAHTRFKRGIGLQELLAIAAERNQGYRGSARDTESLCRAAFRQHGGDGASLMASSGPSTISVSGILSNVANKHLEAGFLYGEQSWRSIARIKSANDFKTLTTYRLTGSNKFERISNGGEIKHGKLGELSYTNKVETYGKMLGLNRQDIRNDDLGALSGASDELGRGAIDSLNEVFWTTFLADSAFFPVDGSNNNYDAGAVDSVLSLAGLENGDLIFGQQVKPDGTPLGAQPKILLVPRTLRARARNLMADAGTAAAQSTATETTKNVWSGMFDVVDSVYLSATAIAGSSSTAWYLLADPANIAAIEVAFLDGIQQPTVETAEFDFDRLGISMRAYLDFGIALAEYRAGVKLKGAA